MRTENIFADNFAQRQRWSEKVYTETANHQKQEVHQNW